jgi:hypothetical protein
MPRIASWQLPGIAGCRRRRRGSLLLLVVLGDQEQGPEEPGPGCPGRLVHVQGAERAGRSAQLGSVIRIYSDSWHPGSMDVCVGLDERRHCGTFPGPATLFLVASSGRWVGLSPLACLVIFRLPPPYLPPINVHPPAF